MNNLLSYCGLVDTRTSASEKDLPVIEEVEENSNLKIDILFSSVFIAIAFQFV